MTGKVEFRFEGKVLGGRPGQSIGAALYAAGVKTLSWSSKYRRPRGMRCVAGACPNCTLVVDGVQGVQSCITPLRGGERVERQRPAFRHLPLDRTSNVTPAGFYYERLAHSPRAWLRAERLLARLAGVAPLAAKGAVGVGGYEERSVGVLVIGGGRRGIAEALEAASAGSSVVLVEREPRLGGRLLNTVAGRGEAARLALRLEESGVRIRLRSTYLGAFEEGLAGVLGDERLTVFRTQRLVEALGSLDVEMAFPDGDRPGVFLGGGVARLLGREGVAPGAAGVLVGPPAERAPLRRTLDEAGVPVVAEAEAEELTAAHGRHSVTSVSLGQRRVACDFVAIALGRQGSSLRECP